MSFALRETPPLGSTERNYAILAAWDALDAGLPPEGSDEIDPLLKDILQDPFALENSGQERGSVARLAWRLGVLRDMGDLVTKSVANLSIDRSTTGFGFYGHLKNRSTAQALITANPNFLKEAGQNDQDSLWRLINLDPKADPADNFIESLDIFKDAIYIPPSILEKIRYQRDNTASMYHPPTIETVRGSKRKIKEFKRYPSSDEKELIEAEERLILGGFLAIHTNEGFDIAPAHLAALDYTHRFIDKSLLGLQKAMQCASRMHRLGFVEDQWGNSIFQNLDHAVNSRAAQANLSWLSLEQIVNLAEAAYPFSSVTSHPGFQTFNSTLHKELKHYMGKLETEAGIKTSPLHRRCKEVLDQYDKVIPQKPATETVANNLKMLDADALRDALGIVGSELNREKRQTLREYFDNIIDDATIDIKSGTAEQQLAFIDKHRSRIVPLLVGFDTGSQLIDRCINSSTKILAEQPEARHNTVDSIHSAMRCNLDYYCDPDKTDQSVIDNLNRVVEAIAVDADNDTTLKMRKILDIIDQRRPLAATSDAKQKSPLYELLDYYRTLDSIKL